MHVRLPELLVLRITTDNRRRIWLVVPDLQRVSRSNLHDVPESSR